MSSTCSVPPRDLVSVEVAAEQVGAHPQTLLTRSTFPVHYPVLAPERGARWQTHAQRRNLGISVRLATRHQRQHVQRMFGTSTRSGFRRGCGPASWRPPSDLVDQVHVSGALSGARTGKGPQMANPRPTPKPGNLGPPWPPGTSGNMSSACSALPRDLVSVEVAAEQVGAHP